VIWQLLASLALGASALGTSLTLAAMMSGFALGSLLAGPLLARWAPRRPVRLYAALEATVGVAGLLVLPGFHLLERLDRHVYEVAPGVAPVLHGVGVFALLLPATCAMGATVPAFQGIAQRHDLFIARLYGLNILGGAVGVLGLSFALLPALGVWRAAAWLAALDAAVAVSLLVLVRGGGRQPDAALGVAAGPTPVVPESTSYRNVALPLVFATGFAVFALEVAWFRSLTAAFRSTTHTFAILLAAVLLPLGVAARLVPRLRRRDVTPAAMLCAAGVAVLLATPLVERMDLFALAAPGGYALRLIQYLLLSVGVVSPAVLLLGLPLPWCLEEFPDPSRTSRLYALNTVASVAGSLAAAWLLLPTLGFARTSWLLGGALLLLAFGLSRGRVRWLAVVAGPAALAVAVQSTSSLGRERVQQASAFSVGAILGYQEGADTTVSVIEDGRGHRRLLIDGFSASSESPGTAYMEWMGRLPALLHPDPHDGLVIGFGTGQTAHALRDEGVTRLDVAELDGAVLAMAPLFPSNFGVLDQPGVTAHEMDGRAWLRRSTRRYDAVTVEPMPPYFAGVNALYSREFYQLVRARLAPGGVVAQWLPFHLVPPEFAAAMTATFIAVFPDSALWIDPETSTGILLGRAEADADELGSRWPGLARERPRGLPPDRIREALALRAEALERYARGAEPISDDNQRLAYGLLRQVAGDDRWHDRRRAMQQANLYRVRHFEPGVR